MAPDEIIRDAILKSQRILQSYLDDEERRPALTLEKLIEVLRDDHLILALRGVDEAVHPGSWTLETIDGLVEELDKVIGTPGTPDASSG